MNINAGDIDITTEDNPEGDIGTFTPNLMTFGVSYAKMFSNSISGGITLKGVSESISNVKASGVALDMGVKYVTGENDKVKFGIALRNVGPKMKYEGDGLTEKVTVNGGDYSMEQRSESFELPSLLNIGVSYDFYLGASSDSTGNTLPLHRVTAAGNFTSNSFGKDQLRGGLEYGFKNMFMARFGYVYEQGLNDANSLTTFNLGPTAGVTLEVPISGSGSTFGFDYAYRMASAQGFSHPSHAIGIRINL